METTSTVTLASLSQIVLNYLDVLIWPATVILIAFFFRVEVRGLLGRIQAFKFRDFEIHSPAQDLPSDEVSDEVKEEIKETIEGKRKEIESQKKTTEVPTKEQLQSQVSALLNQVATLQSAFLFERLYNLVFGSQIDILENLRKNMDGLWHVAFASWYEQIKANDSVLKNYPFDDYVAFLVNTNLIKPIETSHGKKYIITDLGVDFLSYIEKTGYVKHKPH